MSPNRRIVSALALLVLVSATGASTVAARAPPTPVCGVCSDALETAANERNATVERGETALTVAVHENGSATWRATVELRRGSDAFENDSLRRDVVAAATGRSIADATDLRSRVDGDVLEVTFRDPGAAESHFGVVVFTPLVPDSPALPFASGGEGPRYLGADRVTVRGPADYRVYGDYPGATESGRSVTWTRNASAERTYVDGGPKVALVPEGSLLGGVRAWAARTLAS